MEMVVLVQKRYGLAMQLPENISATRVARRLKSAVVEFIEILGEGHMKNGTLFRIHTGCGIWMNLALCLCPNPVRLFLLKVQKDCTS